MTEVDRTASIMSGLTPSTGRGLKILAAVIDIQDGETFDTGLDKIYAAVPAINKTPTNDYVDRTTMSISGGTITFAFKKMQISTGNTWGANSTATEHHVVVIGTTK